MEKKEDEGKDRLSSSSLLVELDDFNLSLMRIQLSLKCFLKKEQEGKKKSENGEEIQGIVNSLLTQTLPQVKNKVGRILKWLRTGQGDFGGGRGVNVKIKVEEEESSFLEGEDGEYEGKFTAFTEFCATAKYSDIEDDSANEDEVYKPPEEGEESTQNSWSYPWEETVPDVPSVVATTSVLPMSMTAHKKTKTNRASEADSSTLAQKRERTSFKLKLDALKYFEEGHSLSATGRKFGVDRKTIKWWVAKKDKIQQAAKVNGLNARKNLGGQGRPLAYKEIEEPLFSWVQKQINLKASLTLRNVLNRAKILAEEMSFVTFKGTRSWAKRFLTRRGIKFHDESGSIKIITESPPVVISQSQSQSCSETSDEDDDEADPSYMPDEDVDNTQDPLVVCKNESLNKLFVNPISTIPSEAEGNPTSTNTTCPEKEKRKYHPFETRLDALDYIEQGHSLTATAKQFGVDRKTIDRWVKSKGRIVEAAEAKAGGLNQLDRLGGQGRRPAYPQLEEPLLTWIQDQTQAGSPLNMLIILNKAKAMSEENNDTTFIGGMSWVKRFMRRKGIKLSGHGRNKTPSDDTSISLLSQRYHFECDICQKTYPYKSTLYLHKKVQHSEEGRKHLCQTCGKLFNYKHHLREHVDLVHLNLRNFLCSICAQAFKTPRDLKKHSATHQGQCTPGFEFIPKRARTTATVTTSSIDPPNVPIDFVNFPLMHVHPSFNPYRNNY